MVFRWCSTGGLESDAALDVGQEVFDGDGGVVVGNIFQRLAWALRFGDLDTLISNQVTSDSRILLERKQPVQRLMCGLRNTLRMGMLQPGVYL